MSCFERKQFSSERAYRVACATLLGLVLHAASRCPAEQLKVTPYKSSGIYAHGEKAGWTLTRSADGAKSEPAYAYTIKKNNLDLIKSGSLDLSSGKANIEATSDEPAM